jgi:hypothetical protein
VQKQLPAPGDEFGCAVVAAAPHLAQQALDAPLPPALVLLCGHGEGGCLVLLLQGALLQLALHQAPPLAVAQLGVLAAGRGRRRRRLVLLLVPPVPRREARTLLRLVLRLKAQQASQLADSPPGGATAAAACLCQRLRAARPKPGLGSRSTAG